MAVGGITGFVLDNLLPGTLEERGILKWRCLFGESSNRNNRVASIHTYDVPLVTSYLQKFKAVRYVPFLPYYGENHSDKPVGMDTYRKTSYTNSGNNI